MIIIIILCKFSNNTFIIIEFISIIINIFGYLYIYIQAKMIWKQIFLFVSGIRDSCTSPSRYIGFKGDQKVFI